MPVRSWLESWGAFLRGPPAAPILTHMFRLPFFSWIPVATSFYPKEGSGFIVAQSGVDLVAHVLPRQSFAFAQREAETVAGCPTVGRKTRLILLHVKATGVCNAEGRNLKRYYDQCPDPWPKRSTWRPFPVTAVLGIFHSFCFNMSQLLAA